MIQNTPFERLSVRLLKDCCLNNLLESEAFQLITALFKQPLNSSQLNFIFSEFAPLLFAVKKSFNSDFILSLSSLLRLYSISSSQSSLSLQSSSSDVSQLWKVVKSDIKSAFQDKVNESECLILLSSLLSVAELEFQKEIFNEFLLPLRHSNSAEFISVLGDLNLSIAISHVGVIFQHL